MSFALPFAIWMMVAFFQTVPIELEDAARSEFVGRYAININDMMAGGILAALPPVILALALKRIIVRGMTSGAVKG